MVVMEKLICGKIALFREICPFCQEYNLSGNPAFICTSCDAKYTGTIDLTERILSNNKRKSLTSRQSEKIAQKQQNHCFWCDRQFGSLIIKNHKTIQLKIHLDHVQPYSYTKTNNQDNLIASCQICNQWKSNKIFDNVDTCKEYLTGKWNKAIRLHKIVIVE